MARSEKIRMMPRTRLSSLDQSTNPECRVVEPSERSESAGRVPVSLVFRAETLSAKVECNLPRRGPWE